VGRCI